MMVSFHLLILGFLALISCVAPTLMTDDISSTRSQKLAEFSLSRRVDAGFVDLRRTMIKDFRLDILTLRAKVPDMTSTCQSSIRAEVFIMVQKIAQYTGQSLATIKRDSFEGLLDTFEKYLPAIEPSQVSFINLTKLNFQRRKIFKQVERCQM